MESLKEVLDEEGVKNFGTALIESFDKFGFGVYSKADFEAFIFDQLSLNMKSDAVLSNYDWMRLLKITPSKLRSLQMTRSAKFLDLDLNNEKNWKWIFKALESKKLETEDKENGKVKFYIDDLHVHRLIERFVVESGSSIDYALNRNQLVLKYTEFLNLLNAILEKAGKEPLIEAINEDRSALKVENEFDKLDSVFKELKEKFKDEAYSEISKQAISTIVKIAKKKLGI
jgi:hypothetical protein